MKRFYLLLVAAVLFAALPANALLVDTSPTPLQEASTDVVLTYNAASPLGNGALKNLTPSIDVYAHIGVITSKSTGTSDWKYVVTPARPPIPKRTVLNSYRQTNTPCR